jgi:hypothetical protein
MEAHGREWRYSSYSYLTSDTVLQQKHYFYIVSSGVADHNYWFICNYGGFGKHSHGGVLPFYFLNKLHYEVKITPVLLYAWRKETGSHLCVLLFLLYTGQFKKKITLSHIYNEVTSEPTITRYTTIVRKTLKVLDTERLLLWSRHFAIQSPLAAARNTFPRQIQANFESFPNNCCISRDCRLSGYFIINMWKCYLLS